MNFLLLQTAAIIGVDNLSGYILQKPIISDVVLTRGWTEDEPEVDETPAVRSSSIRKSAYLVSTEYKPKLIKYAKRSIFEKPEQRTTVTIDYTPMTYEQLMINLEKYKNR